MNFSTHLLRRLGMALLALAFVVGVAATSSHAHIGAHGFIPFSLSGDARFQIGDGLPIPISFPPGPPPHGNLIVPPSGVVSQTTGPDPKKMSFPPGGAFSNPSPSQNQGVFPFNTNVFQVRTAIQFPGNANPFILSAGKRTGGSVTTFCPGVSGTGGAFACTGPNDGVVPGLMRYTKTKNQFGGVNAAGAGVSGNADVAIPVNGIPVAGMTVVVTAQFAFANPAATGANGAPFGFNNMTIPPIPGSASGAGVFMANGLGSLVSIVSSGTGPGVGNTASSWGGPWTTGRITVSQPLATETFVLTGSDNRVNGVGKISLVSGAVSARVQTGPNANRGWLNFFVGPRINVPALPIPGLIGVFGLLAVAGGYALRRVRTAA